MNAPNAKIASQVAIDQANGPSRIATNHATRRYFKLGIREADFLESLDGSRSTQELASANAQGFKAAEVEHLVTWFTAQGLLDLGSNVLEQPKTPLERVRLFLFGPDAWRLHLVNPNEFMNARRGLIDMLFTRAAFAVYLMIILSPLVAFIFVPDQFLGMTLAGVAAFGLADWITLYLSIVGTIVVHEMAHAITCKHYGGNVYRIGIKFLYLQPVMYCDISDSWRFSSRQAKISVAAAGIFAQAIIFSLTLLLWLAVHSDLLLYFAVFNAVVGVLNFFPLIKLDGYWMLVHLLDEPNLRSKSFLALDTMLKRALAGAPAAAVQPAPALVCFGIGSVLSIGLFFSLGLYTINKYLAYFSETVALSVVTAILVFVAFRFWRPALAYIRSFRPALESA